MRTAPLAEVAQVVRSKNAGPFLLTLDVVFRGAEPYRACKRAAVFTRETIAALYGVPVARVAAVIHYDPAHAVKVTLHRAVASGGPGDSDVYGSQQHAPLLEMQVPLPE